MKKMVAGYVSSNMDRKVNHKIGGKDKGIFKIRIKKPGTNNIACTALQIMQ
jgi:hypothetical protein